MSTVTGTRHTADERRAEILEAAVEAFALTGYAGTSTESIARAVGISQPYLFRLYGTKKELFLTAVEWCFREVIDTFMAAARSAPRREDVLRHVALAYRRLITDRPRLQLQMQAYAACEDPDVRAVVQRGFEQLVAALSAVSGATPAELAHFLAQGMLLNVLAAMGVEDADTGWAATIREGCMAQLP